MKTTLILVLHVVAMTLFTGLLHAETPASSYAPVPLGKAGDRLVADHLGKYHQQWTESMTLRPMAAGVAVMGKDGGTTTLTVTLTPPELLLISIPRANVRGN